MTSECPGPNSAALRRDETTRFRSASIASYYKLANGNNFSHRRSARPSQSVEKRHSAVDSTKVADETLASLRSKQSSQNHPPIEDPSRTTLRRLPHLDSTLPLNSSLPSRNFARAQDSTRYGARSPYLEVNRKFARQPDTALALLFDLL